MCVGSATNPITLFLTRTRMYIVAIGWMYVVTLMAATETNLAAGLATFLFYGLFPCSVLIYIMGTGRRRAKREAMEQQVHSAAQPADQSNQNQDLSSPNG